MSKQLTNIRDIDSEWEDDEVEASVSWTLVSLLLSFSYRKS
jgi:hypothetical protein